MDASNNQAHRALHDHRRRETRSRIIVVAGATAVGKTALGIALAQEHDGEVVNVDSRYLYRGFNIGVAKPGPVERQGISHHLIDILPPDGQMSLARYQDLALEAIEKVLGRGKLPILVGGTPLYVNAVVEGWRIPRVPPNPSLRAKLEAEARTRGLSVLRERLRDVDPVAAERTGVNARRVIRALEIYEATGIPMSAQEGKGPPPYTVLEIGLTMPRADLYRAVDNRVREQIECGLVEEVRSLLESGIPANAQAMSSLGYRQLIPYLSGASSLAEAVERICLDTHRYVRHQETWLRRNKRLIWFDVTRPGWKTDVRARVQAFLTAPLASGPEPPPPV